ncbi:MAG: hypothetical protein Q7U34_15505 [Anaerolineales bacterium]|nr:hypothetical protein [Anaerolineales bacterium]MDP3185547.1 hypothetical protein [Anaerolineales bacterium]
MRCYFLITLALLASTALGAALAACSPSPRVSPSPSLPNTPSPLPPSPFILPPSETPTPEPAQPDAPHGLSAVNAASQTFENGQWVVKNAAGEITATYTPETGWVYEWEKIKAEQALLIYGNGNTTIEVDESLMVLPEYDPSKALIMNGNPIKDGIVIFSKINMTGGQNGNWDQDVALISARIIGAMKLDTVTINRKQVDRYLLSYGIQLSPDKRVISVSVVEDGGETSIFVLPNADATNININDSSAKKSF